LSIPGYPKSSIRKIWLSFYAAVPYRPKLGPVYFWLGNLASSLNLAWSAWLSTEYGLGRFSIWLPPGAAEADQFRLRMQLLRWRWKLTGIDLPENAAGLPSARAVKSLKLATHSPTFWNSNIDVRVTPISITPQPTAIALASAQRLMEPSPQSRPIKGTTATCKIDFVNGERYQPNLTHKDHGGTLRLQGWIAPPPNVDSTSMSTWAALTSDEGKTEYFKAVPQNRSDVIAALKRPAFGFDITLDLKAHPGKQIIRLFSVSESAAYQCSATISVK
jgi:hypothetical protein